MGIVANAKAYIARKAEIAKNKINDIVAQSAGLSPEQLKAIEEKKNNYFKKADDSESKCVIERNIGAMAIEVHQAYLDGLKKIYRPVDEVIDHFDALNRIKHFDIKKWVVDSNEKSLDKLVNVYQVVSGECCNVAIIYDRKKEGCEVSLGVTNSSEERCDPAIINSYANRISGALKGNFPGVKIQNKDNGIPDALKELNKSDLSEKYSVAIVSNLASEKSENFISQSIEKLLDGIVPQSEEDEYKIVLIANPVTNLYERKNRLYEIYSSLIPYASWQTNYSYSENESQGASASLGVHTSITLGKNNSVGVSVPVEGANLNVSQGRSSAFNFGTQFARVSNVSVQIGKNEGITQNYGNYGVQHTLELIEQQLKRLEESSALGMWEFAAYIIAKSPVVANNVAHMYLSLTQGEDSYMTNACIELWDGEREDETQIILNNIQKLQHPVFGLMENCSDEWLQYPTIITPSTFLSGKELAKALNFPRKSINGLPVIQCAEFERNVVHKEKVKFKKEDENNDNCEKRQFELGEIYHMHEFEDTKVPIDIDELTKHTFITGSTGSGKSTTIYKMLHELSQNEINFLVVEPAKGEYYKEFENVANVYTTNTNYGDLLRINPFSFPTVGDNRVFVTEHIDRLNNIFNACWPMYAAMPAVLKEALEAAYEEAGWDLVKSENCLNAELFPTFEDLLIQLKRVIKESDFSEEVKSNYTGALITRVKSLTNGIYRQIFTSNELTNEDLFQNNVIVDISKMGSPETKSLIMGLIITKMQEYHMSHSAQKRMLKHVTVIEEAHNLLKKTSVDQSQESANVQGKSIELIANAIAEMRTYGEGFIIADQAPGLLDESVIRNTNTKIIMSLPDYSDRELVGKSVGLNENQIIEITRLPQGKAIVYQNNWIAPVLCAVTAYDKKGLNSKVTKTISINTGADLSWYKNKIEEYVLYNKIDKFDDACIRKLLKLDVPVESKMRILKRVKSKEKFTKQDKIEIIYDFCATERVKNVVKKTEYNLDMVKKQEQKMFELEFQKWKEVLGFKEITLIEKTIINIILCKIKRSENIELKQCERLFNYIEGWCK